MPRLAAVEQVAAEPAAPAQQAGAVAQLAVDLAPARRQRNRPPVGGRGCGRIIISDREQQRKPPLSTRSGWARRKPRRSPLVSTPVLARSSHKPEVWKRPPLKVVQPRRAEQRRRSSRGQDRAAPRASRNRLVDPPPPSASDIRPPSRSGVLVEPAEIARQPIAAELAVDADAGPAIGRAGRAGLDVLPHLAGFARDGHAGRAEGRGEARCCRRAWRRSPDRR